MPQQHEISFSPLANACADQYQQWREMYGTLFGGMFPAGFGLTQGTFTPEGGTTMHWQLLPDAFPRQMIEAQIEFYKFMTHGLEEYKKVLQAAPHTSPFEFTQLYSGFLVRMANACMAETKRLAEIFVTGRTETHAPTH